MSMIPEVMDWAHRQGLVWKEVIEEPGFIERAQAGELTQDETLCLFHGFKTYFPEQWQEICRDMVEGLSEKDQQKLADGIRECWRYRELRMEQYYRRQARRAALSLVNDED